MAEISLVSSKILSSPAFVRDLTSFLNLSEQALLAIAQFGEDTEGFTGRSKADRLNTQFDVPSNQTMGVLRLAKYLYDRATELQLDASSATRQVESIALGLSPPIHIGVSRAQAIEAILAYKREYEVSEASRKAISDGPHYSEITGSWSVKLLHTRAGEIVKVPAMILNLAWHDGSGEHHELLLQMSDADWREFGDKISDLTSRREHLNALL